MTQRNAYRDVLKLAARARREGFLRAYRTDLIKHDKALLQNYTGPWLWAIREHGTHTLTPAVACYGENHAGMWQKVTENYYGRAKVYYGTGKSAPRRVSTPHEARAIAERWERACKQRFSPWTGKPIS